jgi:hypothetical protein
MDATGSLFPMRIRHWRTNRQRYAQVSTNWSTPTGWVLMGINCGKSPAQLCTIPNMPTQANTIPAHAGTSPNMPARLWNRRRRRVSRCVKDTYIAGYALRSLFGADVRPAWAAVAKGLKSNDLRSGASLPRRPAFREKLAGNVNRRRGGGRQSTALIVTLPIAGAANCGEPVFQLAYVEAASAAFSAKRY